MIKKKKHFLGISNIPRTIMRFLKANSFQHRNHHSNLLSQKLRRLKDKKRAEEIDKIIEEEL